MEENGLWVKILAVTGTALVAIPLIAPFALARWGGPAGLMVDWLIPGELGLLVVAGAALLFWAAYIAHQRRAAVGWGIAAAIVSFVAASLLAQFTGLASGAAQPEGWRLWLVMGFYAAYVAAVIELAITGVLLSIDVLKHHGHEPPALPVA